jgi:hypothetical protein
MKFTAKHKKTALSNQSILTALQQQSWFGHFKLDGGWGAKSLVLEKYCADPLIVFDQPLFVQPIQKNYDTEQGIAVDEHYYLAFPECRLIDFMELVGFLKQNTNTKSKVILQNFPETLKAVPEKPLRIVVDIENDSTVFTLLEGTFTPSFKAPFLVAEEVVHA